MIKVTTIPSHIGTGNRTSDGAVLSGNFRHNRGNFMVYLFGGKATLSATATVIQAATYGGMGQTGPLPTAAEGDLIEVDGKTYRIVDDKRGYDPRLVGTIDSSCWCESPDQQCVSPICQNR